MCVTTAAAAAAAVVCHSPTLPTTIKLRKVCRLVAKDGTTTIELLLYQTRIYFVSQTARIAITIY